MSPASPSSVTVLPQSAKLGPAIMPVVDGVPPDAVRQRVHSIAGLVVAFPTAIEIVSPLSRVVATLLIVAVVLLSVVTPFHDSETT